MSSFSLPSLPPSLTVVCIQQEGSHTSALPGAFHHIEHNTACRCLSGEKGEWTGLFSDLGKGIQVKSIPDRAIIKVHSKTKRNFHNFYSTSEHFLLCEVSGDYKQHSSHACAVAGFGLSEALKCFHNVCLF